MARRVSNGHERKRAKRRTLQWMRTIVMHQWKHRQMKNEGRKDDGVPPGLSLYERRSSMAGCARLAIRILDQKLLLFFSRCSWPSFAVLLKKLTRYIQINAAPYQPEPEEKILLSRKKPPFCYAKHGIRCIARMDEIRRHVCDGLIL